MINIHFNYKTNLIEVYPTKNRGLSRQHANSFMVFVKGMFDKSFKSLIVPAVILGMLLMNIGNVKAHGIIDRPGQDLHTTQGLIGYITKASPSSVFLKGKKPVNGLTYHYSNWNGKGGVQIFSKGEKVTMVSIVTTSAAENLSHLKTPVKIEKFLTDLLGKADAEWFTDALLKLASEKKEMYSKDRQVTLRYDQQIQKLTVTLRIL